MQCLSEKSKQKLSKFLSPREFFNEKLQSQNKFNIQIKKNSVNFQPLILATRSSHEKIKNKSLPLYHRSSKKGKMHTSMNLKEQSKEEQQSKIGRRISSQQKLYKKDLSQGVTNKSQFSINFAKKLLKDMKKQTHKTAQFRQRTLSDSKNLTSRSVSLKKQQNKQKTKNSLQKLAPSFTSRSIYPQVSRNRYREDRNNKDQKYNQTYKESQRKNLIKRQKIEFPGYLQYINADSKDIYKVYQNLSQTKNINHNNFEEHFNEKSCKLIQSLLLCVLDVLGFSEMMNSDIIKQYSSVFLTIHEKSINQFILIDQVFKAARTKLLKYFILLRMTFYSLYAISFDPKFQETKFMNDLIKLFKDSQEVYSSILKILSENHVNNPSGIIDTFKSLRLIRQLQKKIPKIQDFVKLLMHENKKIQQIYAIFEQLLQISTQGQLVQVYDKITIKQQFINWKYFNIPPLPFLPVQTKQYGYTLIIDLDCTLVYYNQQTKILKYRPFMDRFLNTMKKYFQLVIFSSFGKERSDLIIKQIERDDKIFAYRLYKCHMVFKNGNLLKDISLIGRSLKRVLILDDEQKNISVNPLNGLEIKAFYGDKRDKQLMHISDWISGIMEQKPEDLRGKLKKRYQSLQHIEEVEQGTITIQHQDNQTQKQQKLIGRKKSIIPKFSTGQK